VFEISEVGLFWVGIFWWIFLQRQNVVGHYCIAKCAAKGGDRKLGGVIKSEKRDDNGKKIAYQVELFGEVSKPLRVISCSDVKHCLNDAAVQEFVRERVNSSRPAIRTNAEAFRKEWSGEMAPPQGFMVVSQKIEATQFDEGFAAGIGQQSEPP